MQPRASLIFTFTLFSALLLLVSQRVNDRPSSPQNPLKGTWVLSHVERDGEVTSQADDVSKLKALRYSARLPELRGLEVDRYRNCTVVSFADSEFITRENDKIVGIGAYTINRRTHPPTLMIYCVSFEEQIGCVFPGSVQGAYETGLILEPGRFRMLLKASKRKPYDDIVTFERL